jgi:hypothetical protein
MTLRRRVALLLSVAALAATGGVGATAAAQASAATICVALVVDGTALGSNVSTGCATVPKGATGVDVLQSAGHTVGYRNDGLICTIDGLPKMGCAAVDDSHFWAYFHRAPGATSWTYSTEGAGTYQPVNGATEGWVYRDGTEATPANIPHKKICTTTTTTTPSPTPSPSRHPTQPTHQPSRNVSAAPTRSRHSAPAASTSPPAPTRSVHSHPGRRPRPQPKNASAPPSTTSPSIGPIGSVSPSSAALVGGSTSSTGGTGPTALLIGVAAVVVLGGAAAYRFRRGSGRP